MKKVEIRTEPNPTEAVRLFLLNNPSYTPDLRPVATVHALHGHPLPESTVLDAIAKGAPVVRFFHCVAWLRRGHKVANYFSGPDGDFVGLLDVPHQDDLEELPEQVERLEHRCSVPVFPTVGHKIIGAPDSVRSGLYRETARDPWTLASISNFTPVQPLPDFVLPVGKNRMQLAELDSGLLYAVRTPAVTQAVREHDLLAVVAKDHYLIATDLRNDATEQKNEASWCDHDVALYVDVLHQVGRVRRVDSFLWPRPGTAGYWTTGSAHLKATRRGGGWEVSHV